MPKLTIAIPTYNRSRYLRDVIKSVLVQTYRDFELLIVDNASTDDTTEVVKSFSDSRIRYVRNDKTISISENWNRCISLCGNSEYIMFFSDDDLMKETLVQRSIDILEKYPDVAVVQSDFAGIDHNGNMISDKISNIHKDQYYKPLEFIDSNLTYQYAFGIFAMMVRGESLKERKLEFNNKALGWSHILMCLSLNLQYAVYFIADPLGYYRYHGTGSSGQDSRKPTVYKDVVDFYQEVVKFVRVNELTSLLHKAKHGLLNYEFLRLAYQSDERLKFTSELLDLNLREFIKSPDFWKMDSTNGLKNQLFLLSHGYGSPKDSVRTDVIYQHTHDTGPLEIYRKWVSMLLHGHTISESIKNMGVSRVAIFGTRITAYFIIQDFEQNGITVESLLDNNGNMHGRSVSGIPVQGMDWLDSHRVDAVIVTIEGEHREGIKKQIQDKLVDANTQVYTWIDLVQKYDFNL
ncbi:glycosyltransferase [Brevibacillus borstelensis]|uniref:glycosyltransferase n=1 Tax=Brevibacillus borstelensis TaxID=45462 RepID=UPI00203FABBF|nr:glycosyltransferase [Brevibacillus borstelensis]MCM3590185.1 glycosyltransferase [Brevibacillus borstelensis]